MDRWTDRQTHRQTKQREGRQTDRQTVEQSREETDRQTGKADKDRWMEGQTDSREIQCTSFLLTMPFQCSDSVGTGKLGQLQH